MRTGCELPRASSSSSLLLPKRSELAKTPHLLVDGVDPAEQTDVLDENSRLEDRALVSSGSLDDGQHVLHCLSHLGLDFSRDQLHRLGVEGHSCDKGDEGR